MQYHLAPLGQKPNSDLYFSEHHVTSTYAEFQQPDDRWSIIFVEHRNTVQINMYTYMVKFGDLACVPPGARVQWSNWGPDCAFRAVMFTLPHEARPLMAIPNVVYDRAVLDTSFRRVCILCSETRSAAMALAWHVLWDSAQPASILPNQEILYEATAYVETNLHRTISIEELCSTLEIERSALDAAFRAETGIPVSQFISRKKAQEACRLLASPDWSHRDIARQVGLRDPQQLASLLSAHGIDFPDAGATETGVPTW